MAIFSLKKKAKKEDENKDKAPAHEKPKQPYRHVPSHAASDSVGQGGRTDSNQDRMQIAIASRRRMENSAYDSTLGDASYAQSIAHEMAHGTPSPMSPSYQQRSLGSLSWNQSQEAFFTDAHGQPRSGPSSVHRQSSHTQQPRLSRQSSDYFSQEGMRGRTYDASKSRKGKEREYGYATPGYASDSGYESAGPPTALHSRAPSEQNFQDYSGHPISRHTSGFLPELRHGEEMLSEPNLIKRSYSSDGSTELPIAIKSQEGLLKNAGNFSPLDFDYDSRSVKSNKSSGSVSKRARFEDHSEPMPALDQLQSHIQRSPADPEFSSQTVSQIVERAKKRRNASVNSIETSQHPGARASMTTHEAVIARAYMPQPEGIASVPSAWKFSLPPLSILDGLKVNKKGNILDEEGDPIGKLVEGELLDCVRLKANAQGEVLDEYGRVVGIVRTIAGTAQPAVTAVSSQVADTRSVMPTSTQAYRLHEITGLPSLSLNKGSASQELQTGDVQYVSPQLVTPTAQPPNGDQYSRGGQVAAPRRPERPTAGLIESHDEIMCNPQLEQGELVEAAREPSPAQDLSEPTQSVSRDFAADNDSGIARLDQARRMTHNSSERSLLELSKPFARPLMSSVPEDNVPEEDMLPEGPGVFAYKGDVPTDDGPQREVRLRSQSPSLPNILKPALVGGHPGSVLYASIKGGQSPGVPRMHPSRRATTQLTGHPYLNQTLAPRRSVNFTQGRSPLSSHETSPKRSEAGTDATSDDGRMPTIRHARSMSLQSGAGVQNKPRTYFTHGGKVTVDPNAPKPAPAAPKEPASAAVEEKKIEKKKSRLSLGFGKKAAK